VNSDNVIAFAGWKHASRDLAMIAEFPEGLYEDSSVSSVSDWNMWYSTCPN